MVKKYSFLEKGLRYRDLDFLRKNKADWLENSSYSDNTKKSYWVHLNSVRPMEEKKCKDLCWFTKEEIEELIKSKETTRLIIKQSLYSVIKKYMVYSFDRGIIDYNPCDDIDTKELFKTPKANYIKLDNFYELIDSLEMSDIDRMLLTLIRYGVDTGDVGKVKWSDLDEERKELKVNSLTLPVDVRFIKRVSKAKVCKYYHDKVSFIDKGYMIKTSKNSTWTSIPKEQVHNKINNLSTFNNIDRLSPNDIRVSREFDLLFNIFVLYGEVTYADYRRVLSIYEENVTQSKVTRLKNLFESVSGVKTVKAKNKGRKSKK